MNVFLKGMAVIAVKLGLSPLGNAATYRTNLEVNDVNFTQYQRLSEQATGFTLIVRRNTDSAFYLQNDNDGGWSDSAFVAYIPQGTGAVTFDHPDEVIINVREGFPGVNQFGSGGLLRVGPNEWNQL